MSYRAPLHGLGQTTTTAGKTTTGSGAPDQGWQTAGQVAQVGVPLLTSIIGAATGQSTTTQQQLQQQQLLQQQMLMQGQTQSSTSWYWPVMLTVGVLVIGGVAYMVMKKPKTVAGAKPAKATANRRSRRNGRRRRRGSRRRSN